MAYKSEFHQSCLVYQALLFKPQNEKNVWRMQSRQANKKRKIIPNKMS